MRKGLFSLIVAGVLSISAGAPPTPARPPVVPMKPVLPHSGPSNDGAWGSGWTNLVPSNHTGQTFKAVSPRIATIDLDLLTGNPGRAASDTLTLTAYEGTTRLGSTSVTLPDGTAGWTRFAFRPPLAVHPNSTIKIELADTGLVMFGWKYGANTYPDGLAILLGVNHPESDFRFRVNTP